MINKDVSDILVSIIIPTYNRAWGLTLSIESAVAQTHHNIEIVIVDDFSQDETPQVIASFAEQDKRIVPFRQSRNKGMVGNWGCGLSLCKGEFFIFLADDDQLQPDFVLNRLEKIYADSRLGVVFSRYHIKDRNGAFLGLQNEEWQKEKKLDSEALLHCALERRWFVGASLYRKSVVENMWSAIQQDDLLLDFGLNVRIATCSHYHGLYLPDPDFVMLKHEGQNTQAKRIQVFEQAITVLKRLVSEEKNNKYALLLRRDLANWYVMWGRYTASRGSIRKARQRFIHALRISPTSRYAWMNLLLSCLLPKRLIKRARREMTF